MVLFHDKIQKQLGFVHRFVPATEVEVETSELLLIQHQKQLLYFFCTELEEMKMTCCALGRGLDPSSALLSPRGKILVDIRIPRFFRRLAEGVFDIEDIKYRTQELADFVEEASHI